MARGVQLQRYAMTTHETMDASTFVLRVVATTGNNMPDLNIFLFSRTPLDPTTGTIDRFETVTTPSDLATRPVGTPVGSDPFFRKNEVTLYLRSRIEYDATWVSIRDAVARLCRILDMADALVLAETQWTGAQP
jgi:hypothetical protein